MLSGDYLTVEPSIYVFPKALVLALYAAYDKDNLSAWLYWNLRVYKLNTACGMPILLYLSRQNIV